MHISPRMEVGLFGRMIADPNARQKTIWYSKYMKLPMNVVPLVASLAKEDKAPQNLSLVAPFS